MIGYSVSIFEGARGRIPEGDIPFESRKQFPAHLTLEYHLLKDPPYEP